MLRRNCLMLLFSCLTGCSAFPKRSGETADNSSPPKKSLWGKPESSDIKLASAEKEKEESNNVFHVLFETTAGNFVVEVHRDWAPIGAQRFCELVEAKFYDNCKFFRVIPDFMVQFGVNGDPEVDAKYKDSQIQDDTVHRSNKKGFVTFAKTGAPNSRSTQIFVNLKNNPFLDDQDFAPFGKVVKGMDNVEKINSEYKDKPDQMKIKKKGNAYLERDFPHLDGIVRASFVDYDEKTGKVIEVALQ